ncbi:MAG TPA: diheme cytochrome c-553 [Thermodesulfobacteriota bacterium]|nr:diheme cytochrome c-553 [Thermodesulfobacteriota bacterium]
MKYLNLKFAVFAVLALAAVAAGCNKNAAQQAAAPAPATAYTAAQVTRGAELVNEWKCNFCHTPELKGPDGKPMPNPERLLSGHPQDEKVPDVADMVITSDAFMEFLDNLDNTVWASNDTLVFSANLTPDAETGIGTWTDVEFVGTMRQGMHMGLGRRLLYPMPWQELAELPDADLISIYAYLRTIDPVSNKVPPPVMLYR